MVAFILFILATAGVKGFAFTLGVGTLVSLFTAVLATQAILARCGRSRAARAARRRSARSHAQRRSTLRLHGRVEVVLLDVRRDPADRRAGDRRQGPQLRHRLRVRHADHRRAASSRRREDEVRNALQRRSASATRRSRRSATRTLGQQRRPDLDRRRCSRPKVAARSSDALRRARSASATNCSSTSIGPTFGQTVANTRDHRDHRLAARDLDLHRAALRVEVRGAGADRADARPADHRRRLRARPAGR